MKISLLSPLLVSFLFFHCTSHWEDIASGQGPPLPAGANQLPFPDDPNMIKAWIGNEASPLELGSYYRGTLQGNWTTFHAKGLVHTLSGYVNGKKEGVEVNIDNTGRLVELISYHNGLLEGPYRKFNGNKIKEERNYSNGLLTGNLRIYYDNEIVMEESSYQNGKRHGIARWYDQEGNLTIEYEYNQGELVKLDSL